MALTSIRHQLLFIGHDIPSSGHLGIRKSLDRLIRHFWWSSIQSDVRDVTNVNCLACLSSQNLGLFVLLILLVRCLFVPRPGIVLFSLFFRSLYSLSSGNCIEKAYGEGRCVSFNECVSTSCFSSNFLIKFCALSERK